MTKYNSDKCDQQPLKNEAKNLRLRLSGIAYPSILCVMALAFFLLGLLTTFGHHSRFKYLAIPNNGADFRYNVYTEQR